MPIEWKLSVILVPLCRSPTLKRPIEILVLWPSILWQEYNLMVFQRDLRTILRGMYILNPLNLRFWWPTRNSSRRLLSTRTPPIALLIYIDYFIE